MLLVLQILGIVLLALLGAILLAIFMPLRIELQASRRDALSYSAALRPFGQFGPRIPLSKGRAKPPQDAKVDKPPPKKTARRRRWKTHPMQMVRAGVQLIADVIGQFRIETADLDLRFGLGDPGETGQVYGQIVPLIHCASSLPHVRLCVEPAFDRAVLTGQAALDVSVVPARLVPPLLRFGWVAFGPVR